MKTPLYPGLCRAAKACRKPYRHAATQELANAISRRVFALGLAVFAASLALYGLIAGIDWIVQWLVAAATGVFRAFEWLFVPGLDGTPPRVSLKAPFVAVVTFMIFIEMQRIRLCLHATDLVKLEETMPSVGVEGAKDLRHRWSSVDTWERRASVGCILLLFAIAVGNMQPWVQFSAVNVDKMLDSVWAWLVYFWVGLVGIFIFRGFVASVVAFYMIPAAQRNAWVASCDVYIEDYFEKVTAHIEEKSQLNESP